METTTIGDVLPKAAGMSKLRDHIARQQRRLSELAHEASASEAYRIGMVVGALAQLDDALLGVLIIASCHCDSAAAEAALRA